MGLHERLEISLTEEHRNEERRNEQWRQEKKLGVIVRNENKDTSGVQLTHLRY